LLKCCWSWELSRWFVLRFAAELKKDYAEMRVKQLELLESQLKSTIELYWLSRWKMRYWNFLTNFALAPVQ
jgi:hypothetical protein